jgi:hypothetical protein
MPHQLTAQTTEAWPWLQTEVMGDLGGLSSHQLKLDIKSPGIPALMDVASVFEGPADGTWTLGGCLPRSFWLHF